MAGQASEKSSQLQASKQADAALSPEQRKYKQLATKIEKAKLELLAWQEQGAWFAQQRHERMQPLLAELAACQLRFVKRLEVLLAGPGRSALERETMRRALCDQAAILVDSEFITEAQSDELAALHDLHADVSLDAANADAVAEAKAMFEAASGVDLGDEQFDSHDDLLERVQQKLREQAQGQGHQGHPGQMPEDAAQSDFSAQHAHQPRKPTAAQKRKESAAQRDAQEASLSVREVFRKLASALHPDRASNDEDRTRRTALMQRVNQAYAKEDLLGLFALQLEIEQIDPAHLNNASSERMRHYNRVLASQLQELQAEIEAREEAFCMQFGIEPWLRVKPSQLPSLLNQQLKGLQFAVMQGQSDLKQLDLPANLKRLLKLLRKEQEANDSDDFFAPF